MRILAIDPGPTESAFLLYSLDNQVPIDWGKDKNENVRRIVNQSMSDQCAIENVASYGMAVGAEVFETCIWIGRFIETWRVGHLAWDPRLVFRREVKLHLCGVANAKDSNIRQALMDRYGGKERAIGRKASPGPLYGVKADIWSALAVAVTAAETAAT